MDLTAAFPTFIITLREGFEAALVVGIVMACLQKAQQTQLYRWVYLGIFAGILASISVGVLLAHTVTGIENAGGIYTNVLKQILAGSFGIVAIAMLSWMLVWMSLQAKSLKGEVESAISDALNQDNAGKGIFLLIFIAVLREGFETVLFILAKFPQQLLLPTIGAVVGLIVAATMGYLLFALGIKINISLFFKAMGIFLLLIVDGLVLSALYHLDQGISLFAELSHNNWCNINTESCFLGGQVWDGSRLLPDRQFPGIILKALFGYRQTLYIGQVIAYFSFLIIVGTLYFQSLTTRKVKASAN
ncbi:MAG: FTR1 family protein [Xenococcaceae cyanobacterium MO_167.B52]|nr:FTR1 family protein [Xenococcaceae cyanobacterium MO_167.B52]